MAKKFKDLAAKMSPRAQARARLKAELMSARIKLADLRRATGTTQSQVALRLGVSQATVSGFENERDIMVGTLTRYVEALGGKLSISVQFPEGKVVLETVVAK